MFIALFGSYARLESKVPCSFQLPDVSHAPAQLSIASHAPAQLLVTSHVPQQYQRYQRS